MVPEHNSRNLVEARDINIFDAEQLKLIQASLHESSHADHEFFSKQCLELFKAAGVPAEEPKLDGSNAVYSFINGKSIYRLPETTPQEYARIFAKAETSQKFWSNLPVEGRQEFFKTVTEVAAKYKPLIDLTITLEVGKFGSEFSKLGEWDKWATSPNIKAKLGSSTYLQTKLGDRVTKPSDIPEKDDVVYYHIQEDAKGIGVVGDTCGFNYPAALTMPGVTASRLTGNAFIGKVPSKAPSFLYIRKMIENEALELMGARFEQYSWKDKARDSGIDLGKPDVRNLLADGFGIISGREVAAEWIKDCKVMRMVGGTSGGKTYKDGRSEIDRHLDRTILELAGNNPVVVMPSAVNLDGGIDKILKENAEGNKSNSGQRCTSPRRWMVHESLYEEFKSKLIDEYKKSANNADGSIGNPLDTSDTRIKVGAMDKGGFKEAQEYLGKVKKIEGVVVIGGERILQDKYPDGYYMAPALVIWDGVKDQAAKNIMHEREIFAPIANLDKISSLKDAIDKTNLSNQKLSGAFYCDEKHLHELMEFLLKTDLGSLIHNGPPKDQSPYGKHQGREDGGNLFTGGVEMLKVYTQVPNTRMMALTRPIAIELLETLQKQRA